MSDGIHIGGLFRCCIMHLGEKLEERKAADLPPYEVGTVLPCKYCSGQAEKKDDGWHWLPNKENKDG